MEWTKMNKEKKKSAETEGVTKVCVMFHLGDKQLPVIVSKNGRHQKHFNMELWVAEHNAKDTMNSLGVGK